jgi:hypothetical protein
LNESISVSTEVVLREQARQSEVFLDVSHPVSVSISIRLRNRQ